MIFKYVSVLLLAISAFAAVDEGTVDPEIDTTIEYDQSTYASTAAFCDAFRTQCTEMVSQLAKDPAVAIDCVHSQPGPVILVTCYGNSDNVGGMYDYTQNILRFVDASTVAGPGESVQQPTSTSSQASSTSARTTSTGIASATSVSTASSMANNTSTASTASRSGQLSSTSMTPVTSTRQSSTLHSSTTSHSSATISGTNLRLLPTTSVTTSQTSREPSATRGTQRSSITSSSLDTVSPHATTSTKTTPRRVRIVSPAEREALRHHRPSAEQRARVQARVQAVIHQWIESGRRRLFDRKSHKHYQTCRIRPVHRRQTHRSPGKRKKAANLTKPKWCS